MKKWKRGLQKGLAYLLMFSMALPTSGIPTLTVHASEEITVSNTCEHHTEHTAECGYIEAVEGSPCTHEHEDTCYTETTVCIHEHTDGCCETEGTVSGNDVETEGTTDGHECTEESGCVTRVLNCQHTHDENCGYVEAVEGHPCAFACTDCVDEPKEEENVCTCEVQCEEDSVNAECPVCSVEGADLSACAGEEGDECTCGTDDETIHATNCPAYVAPENPECTCAEKCTEETANIWCDVCGFDYTACKGMDTATVYENTCEHATIENNICSACGKYGYCGVSGSESSVTWEITGEENNYTLTISGEGAMADYSEEQVETDVYRTTAPWGIYSNSITQVVVEGVTYVGSYAFLRLYKLKSVTLDNNSIEKIGYLAFTWCKELSTIVLPDSLDEIYDGAFASSGLISVKIPNGVTTIGDSTFEGCSKLETLILPAGINTIGSTVISNCGALKIVRFLGTSNPVNIATDAFDTATSETFYVPCTYDGTTFGGRTVTKEHNLAEDTGICTYCKGHCGAEGNEGNVIWSFKDGTLTISGSGAMADYSEEKVETDVYRTTAPWGIYADSINKVVVKYGVTNIGNDAFSSCKMITDVSLANSISIVGEWAFYNCDNLKSIFLPDSLGEIKKGGFAHCDQLESVNWSSENKLTVIKSFVFADCDALETVILPSGVETIEEQAFERTSLVYLEIPATVKKIECFLIQDELTIRYLGTTSPECSRGCDATTVEVPCTYSGTTFGGKTVTIGHFEANTGKSNLSYTAQENVITQHCIDCGDCGTATITVADNLVYDGTNQDDEISVTYSEGWLGDKPEATVSPTMVINAGDYTASVIYKDAPAEKSFTVAQRPLTITANSQTIIYGGSIEMGVAQISGELATGDKFSEVILTTENIDATDNGTITPSNVKIVNANGEDVTANYNITYNTGKLIIEPKKVDNPTIEINNLEDIVYDGQEKKPTVVVKDEDTVIPSSEYTVAYSDNTNAGENTATVTITDKDGGNYTVSGTTTFTIKKSTATVDTDPKAVENLVYTGNDQALVSAGSGTGGTMVYSLSATGTYSEMIPVASGAGDYTVYYKVVGDENHNDSVVSSVQVSIEKATGTGSVTMDDWTYGEEAKTPNPSSDTNGISSVTYLYESTDGKGYSSSVAPTNAGTYKVTATFAETENYNACTAEDEFTIAKVTNYIGTVSAEAVSDTLDPSAVTLNRSDESVAGKLELTDSTLAWDKTTYNWKFTPSDTDNYEILTGTVEITINDTAEPEIKYQVKENSWKKFLNTITLGLLCDDYKELTIKCTDATSGVKEVSYYISVNGLTEAEDKWLTVLGDGEHEVIIEESLTERGDYVIYVKASDNAGKDASIAWERILLYENSEALEAARNIEITYGDTADKTSMVTLNGNTIKEIKQGGTALTENTDYTIDYNDDGTATITLKGTYLSDLDANTEGYEITVSYHPLGIAGVVPDEGSMPVDTTFKVVVNKKELTVTGATATGRYYDTTDEVEITAVALTEAIGGDDVSVDVTDLKGTLNSSNAGNYTKVTLPTLTLTGTDAANYTLVQPTEAVDLSSEITIAKLTPTITVPASSFDKTFGDAEFNLGITEDNTDENGKLTYTSSDEAVVKVDENGNVTIKGAREATITVTLAETTNYNAAESKTITVNVAKKAYSVDAINKKYLNTKDNADSIDLSALLPRDCGTVGFGTPQTTGEMSYKVTPSIADEILSYTVASGEVGATGTITVTVSTQNYEDITITVNVELIDQIPVELQEGSSVTLNNSVLTYGEALSELAFNTAVFVDEDGNTVAGTLAWKEPATTPNAGTTSATWVFTPSSEEYASLEGTVAITVQKATPDVTALPEAADTVYNPNAKLSQISLSEGTVSVEGKWEWQTGDIAPTVDNKGYVAVFKPTDNTNYEELMRTIAVTVTKATPVITEASGLAITYGDTLNTSTLSGTAQYSSTDSTAVTGNFAWKDGTVKPTVADSNQTAYTVIFTPSDKVNYNTVETTITITVNKAENAPNMPGATMSVSNKYTKIGDVPLPDGWEWVDAVKEIPLEVDTPVPARAVYVGTDTGNYLNEDVEITVTRSACDHVAGDILYTGEGEKAPTCTEAGLGHKECSKCQTVMESGIVVNALGHTGGTATCKHKAVCTRCKQPYGSTDGSKHGDTEVRGYKAATCTSGGYTGDTHCKDCGAKLASGTATAATGHDYSSEVTKQPTTTEEGVRTYTCANCKDTYTEAIPKLPEEEHQHSYTATITREATCLQTGIKTYTCKCGDSYTETIAKLAHNYTSKVTVEATTDKEGEMTYTCSLCGHSYTEPIAKLTEGSSDAGEAPFIEGDDGKMGWDVISDEIDDATEGDTVVVDMNGSTTVPGDIFEQIKGKDITVTFKLDNGLSWTVNGKSVTADEIGDIDFGVTLGSDEAPLNKIPVDVINNVTGERYSMELTLAYDGEFGFEAVLSVEMDAKNAGLYANLFYYNPNTNETEYICADVIDEKGIAELTFTHASNYLIVIDDVDMGIEDTMGDATDNTTDVEAPKTDDNAWRFVWIIVLGAIVLVVGGIIFFVVAKRRKEEE